MTQEMYIHVVHSPVLPLKTGFLFVVTFVSQSQKIGDGYMADCLRAYAVIMEMLHYVCLVMGDLRPCCRKKETCSNVYYVCDESSRLFAIELQQLQLYGKLALVLT